eukprot:14189870-Ditylum_brightwellii.AAC.1
MQEQFIKFYHEAMLSLVKKTLLEAARQGYLQGWPGFTQATIRKNVDVEDASIKGHLKQVKQGIRSTWSKHVEPECIQEPTNQKTHHIYAAIADLGGAIYTDQTGQFPKMGSLGHSWLSAPPICPHKQY